MNRSELEKKRIAAIEECVILYLTSDLSISDLQLHSRVGMPSISNALNKEDKIKQIFDGINKKVPGIEPIEGIDYGDYINNLIKSKKKQQKEEQIKKSKAYMKSIISNPKYDDSISTNALVDLSKLFTKEERQYDILAKIIFKYRLSLHSASSIIGKSEKEVIEKLGIYKRGYLSKLNLLFDHFSDPNQANALAKFLDAYNKLLYSKRINQKDLFNHILNDFDDTNAIEFIANHKIGDRINEEQAEIIIRLQEKYLLSTKEIEEIFHMHYSTVEKASKMIFEENPVLKNNIEQLKAFYYNNYISNAKKRN